jgi:hypothetical protein
MIYVRLLVGKEIEMRQNRALTCPPIDPSSGAKRLKFNTVKGSTGGSDVWIVYENGRAYPLYVVRYYVGPRDPFRTPYETKQESLKCNSENGKWLYEDNDGWAPFSDGIQLILNKAYDAFLSHGTPHSVQVQADRWKYEVDFAAMVQINLEHHCHKKRRVFFREKATLDL